MATQLKTVYKWWEKIKLTNGKRHQTDNNMTYPLSTTSEKKRERVYQLEVSPNVSGQSTSVICEFDNVLLNTKRTDKSIIEDQTEDKKSFKQVIKGLITPSKSKSPGKRNKLIKRMEKSDCKVLKALIKLNGGKHLSMNSLIQPTDFQTSSPVLGRNNWNQDNANNVDLDADLSDFEHEAIAHNDNNNSSYYDYNYNHDETDPEIQAIMDNDVSVGERSLTREEMSTSGLVRSSSDSEILPIGFDQSSSDDESFGFNREDPLRHSFPGTTNPNRRDSYKKMMRCILENMARDIWNPNGSDSDDDDDLTVDSLEFVNNNFFRSFDDMTTPMDDQLACCDDDSIETPRSAMRDALLEISARRQASMNDTAELNEYSPPPMRKLKRWSHDISMVDWTFDDSQDSALCIDDDDDVTADDDTNTYMRSRVLEVIDEVEEVLDDDSIYRYYYEDPNDIDDPNVQSTYL